MPSRSIKAAISKLRRQIKQLEKDLLTVKQSETYKTIIEISNWDTYFQTTKSKLAKELQELQKEFNSTYFTNFMNFINFQLQKPLTSQVFPTCEVFY